VDGKTSKEKTCDYVGSIVYSFIVYFKTEFSHKTAYRMHINDLIHA